MTPKAFVSTELQISVPVENGPWQELNNQIANEPGFLNKTWFSGAGQVFRLGDIQTAMGINAV